MLPSLGPLPTAERSETTKGYAEVVRSVSTVSGSVITAIVAARETDPHDDDGLAKPATRG